MTDVQRAIDAARAEGCDVVVGVGGGSVIDAAKAAAGMFHAEWTVVELFRGESPLPERTLPWIGVPTTAGAGAEVTPNAVLTDEETGVKQSVRGWNWLARAAFVDPELTVSCPPAVRAYSGMDAFVQAVESFVSRGATPLTEAVSLEAAMQIVRGLPRAFADGGDIEARTAVAWGAMMAGIALANARLGAVHGFAHAVGTACELPHGLVRAVLLPSVVEFNMDVAAGKYAELARAVGAGGGAGRGAGGEAGGGAGAAGGVTSDAAGGIGRVERGVDGAETMARARDFLNFVVDFNCRLGIPSTLGELGLKAEMIDGIVAETLPSGSLAANPKRAGAAELAGILRGHLG